MIQRRLHFPLFIVVLLCTVGVVLTAQPSAAAETAHVEAVRAWISALEQGEDAMAEVRARYYPPPEDGAPDWRPQYRRLRDDLLPLSLVGIRATQDGIQALLDTPQGPVTLGFSFADGESTRISGLRIEAGEGEDGPGLPPLSLPAEPTEWGAAIESYLEPLVTGDVFAGTVLVADPSGEVVWEGASGLASREFDVPNTLETRFDVGSINKDYTQLALWMLARDGKLDFDDTVGKHLPDYPQPRVRDEVTLRQLMDHRSGVPDYFDAAWETTPMRVLRDVDDYLPIWGDRDLLFEPGEREAYSNYGYTILGAVIETVSGLSYPDFVETKIFGPVGMVDSGFFAVDRPEPRVAVGYTHMGPDYTKREDLWKNIYLEPAVGGPWGKSYSPIRDLWRFYQKLFRHQILPRGETWLGDRPFEAQGVALAGGGPGLSAIMFLERGWMVIALANLDPPSAEAVAETILRAVLAVE